MLNLSRRLIFVLYFRWLMISFLIVFVSMGSSCSEEPPQALLLPEIGISPASYIFPPSQFSGQKIYQKFMIRHIGVEGSAALEIQSLEYTGSEQFVLIGSCPKGTNEEICVDKPSLPQKINPGEVLTFSIEYTTSGEIQAHEGIIRVTSNAKNPKNDPQKIDKIILSAQLSDARIDVSTNGQASGNEFPLLFGKSPMNEERTETITLSNVGKANLEVSFSWDGDHEDFKIMDEEGNALIDEAGKAIPITLKVNQQSNVTVKFKPSVCGEQERRLLLKSNAFVYGRDEDKGWSASGPQLSILMRGNSPAQAEISPRTLTFNDVSVGERVEKSFDVKWGASGFCDLFIFGAKIAALEGEEQPKSLQISSFTVGGSSLEPPTSNNPIVIKKGDSLTIGVSFSPTFQSSESGVIDLETNVEGYGKGVVTLLGSTEVNLPPVANFRFLCEEGDCQKDSDLGLDFILPANGRIVVRLDGSISSDRENKITKYKWEFASEPPDPSSSITDAGTDQASFVVSQTGKWRVKLIVEDHGGKTNEKIKILSVQ